jgi:transposase-like protein
VEPNAENRATPPRDGGHPAAQEPLAPFEWTEKREQAAVLLAEDELTVKEVAEKVGISVRQLFAWKANPAFKARIDEVVKEFGAMAGRYAVGRVARRMQSYNATVHGIQRVIAERAADPSMAGVPGGQTGMLVRQIKGIGQGDAFREVHEYSVDTALLKELRDTLRQAAVESGQWTEKKDVTSGGEPLTLIVGVPTEAI